MNSGGYTNIQYARFADDMVILIDAERRSDWLVKAVNMRLREEFAKLFDGQPPLLVSTLIMVPRFNEVAILSAIAEHGETLMDGVPTAYYYLPAHPDLKKYDLSSLTRCWVGGQTLPAAKSVEFTERTGCPVHEVWDMTELAGATSANPVIGLNKPGTIGIPYPGNVMRVVDIEDANRELLPGESGELMFGGPLVMMGYYGNEEGTKETIESDGWLHTGDIATMDHDGFFTIVDRKKDLILTAGFNRARALGRYVFFLAYRRVIAVSGL